MNTAVILFIPFLLSAYTHGSFTSDDLEEVRNEFQWNMNVCMLQRDMQFGQMYQ